MSADMNPDRAAEKAAEKLTKLLRVSSNIHKHRGEYTALFEEASEVFDEGAYPSGKVEKVFKNIRKPGIERFNLCLKLSRHFGKEDERSLNIIKHIDQAIDFFFYLSSLSTNQRKGVFQDVSDKLDDKDGTAREYHKESLTLVSHVVWSAKWEDVFLLICHIATTSRSKSGTKRGPPSIHSSVSQR